MLQKADTSLDDAPDRPASSFIGQQAIVVKSRWTNWRLVAVGGGKSAGLRRSAGWRVNVCARLQPSTYLSVKEPRNSSASAPSPEPGEYIIRLGLAVAAVRGPMSLFASDDSGRWTLIPVTERLVSVSPRSFYRGSVVPILSSPPFTPITSRFSRRGASSLKSVGRG